MKSHLDKWLLSALGGLGLIGWTWAHEEQQVPLWVGYIYIVAMCTIGYLVLFLIGRRRDRLTEAEKYLLGAMREDDQVRVTSMPEHVWAGLRFFYGEGERTAKDAPVAREYLTAFERLKTRLYLRQHEKGLFWKVTSRGAKVRDKLPPRYSEPPSDICRPDLPKPSRRPRPVQDERQREDPAMG